MSRWRRSAPLIYAISDRRRLSSAASSTRRDAERLTDWINALVDAGVDVIQLRERDWPAREMVETARRGAERARETATLVLVNDRADVAQAAGAGGVHLRADGVPVARARSVGPAQWVVGRSTHTIADVTAAQDADYLLFGPIFETVSKPGVPAAGLDRLREAVGGSRVPVVAIGGIDFDNAGECIAAGAAGVAAIGLFAGHDRTTTGTDLVNLVRDLRRRIG